MDNHESQSPSSARKWNLIRLATRSNPSVSYAVDEQGNLIESWSGRNPAVPGASSTAEMRYTPAAALAEFNTSPVLWTRLSSSLRAYIAAKALQADGKTFDPPGLEAAAALAHTSTRSIERALCVVGSGTRELCKAVAGGQISLYAAVDVLALASEDQISLIEAGAKAVVWYAKRLRWERSRRRGAAIGGMGAAVRPRRR